MKKILMAVMLALGLAVSAFAQDADPTRTISFPGDFNLGKWYDAKWDAYWEFSADNIKLYKGDQLICSFKDKIENWKMQAGMQGVEFSFDCKATHRTYKVTKPISANTDLELYVVRDDVPDSDKNKDWRTTIVRKDY